MPGLSTARRASVLLTAACLPAPVSVQRLYPLVHVVTCFIASCHDSEVKIAAVVLTSLAVRGHRAIGVLAVTDGDCHCPSTDRCQQQIDRSYNDAARRLSSSGGRQPASGEVGCPGGGG